MNITQLYEDFNIPYAGEGDKHYRPGWINTACPFCTGHEGNHLGWNLDYDYYFCFRCGWHPISHTIAKLIGVSVRKTDEILKQYKIGKRRIPKESKVKIRAKAHKFPSGTTLLTDRHKQYLEKRGFDPDKLIKEWGLVGTGPVAMLDGINYKHRIIAPVFWNGSQVTFQGRDITGKHRLKYMACPADRELVHHKDILYGKQTAWNGAGICVEGITDVWRFGVHAFATFGIEYTNAQIRIIANAFKKVYIIFDPEAQALRKACELMNELKFRGIEASVISGLDSDPSDMKQDDADYLVKNIMK